MVIDWLASLEWLASFIQIAGVFLNARKNILCWPVFLVGSSSLFCLSCYNQNWPIAMLFFVFFCFNVYGWWSWCHGSPG